MCAREHLLAPSCAASGRQEARFSGSFLFFNCDITQKKICLVTRWMFCITLSLVYFFCKERLVMGPLQPRSRSALLLGRAHTPGSPAPVCRWLWVKISLLC